MGFAMRVSVLVLAACGDVGAAESLAEPSVPEERPAPRTVEDVASVLQQVRRECLSGDGSVSVGFEIERSGRPTNVRVLKTNFVPEPCAPFPPTVPPCLLTEVESLEFGEGAASSVTQVFPSSRRVFFVHDAPFPTPSLQIVDADLPPRTVHPCAE
ncbi:MAG: hypothetical protein AAGE52_36895 [Myxococcota bacterium]